MASIKEVKGKKGISYQITVVNGKDIQGKQIRAYKTWTPDADMTKWEIKRQLDIVAAEFEKKFLADGEAEDKTTFAEYSEYVMSIKHYAPRTRERNKELLERINNAIGHLKLGEIKAKHLNKFLKSLREEGTNKKTGKGLSEKTILEHRRLINMILEKAIVEDIIHKNPVKQTEKITAPQKKVQVFQVEDLINFLLAIENEQLKWKVATYMLTTLGCRRGELIGLRFRDVSMNNGEVNITKQTIYSATSGIIDGTPTKERVESSNRLPDYVLELLKEYKEWYADYMKNYADWKGESNIEDCHIFIRENGQVMHPDSITDWMDKISKRKGLKHANPHKFRHTYASLLLKRQVDIVSVSTLLSHASTTTTLKFYSHLIGNASDISKEKFDDFFKEFQITKQNQA